ncbi:hypothetical protein XENOCAPTIV_029586 [Xenoophorus captivus]|uniref:Uncharacterized protein n=1 Tax=Xenoophorus captivus TaxID=1517983 RepID=A0ABV0RG01_9TELE
MPTPPPPPPLPPPPVWHPLPSTDQVASLPTLTSKEFPSETSSCSSSTQSEESYTNRLSPPSPVCPSAGMCNGHGVYAPLTQSSTMSRQEKRSMKRQRSRQSELQFPLVPGGGVDSMPSLQQLMKGNKDMSVGTIRATAVTGHALVCQFSSSTGSLEVDAAGLVQEQFIKPAGRNSAWILVGPDEIPPLVYQV